MTGICAIAIVIISSLVLSNDPSIQRTATYISAKTDTPCSAVSLRQLSHFFTPAANLFTNVSVWAAFQPYEIDFSFVESMRMV